MIRFDHVTKTYPRGTKPAVEDITLEIKRGEFAFIVGPSGSGKSTLLRLVLREEQVSGGELLVAGHNLRKLPHRKVPRLRRNMGTVFQDFRLLPNKTVAGNVAFALQVTGRSRREVRELVPETLDLVGLGGKESRYPHELSGGEQQRVALARALVNRPPILLADEPTGNLDPVTSLEIVRLLERIHETGTTVMMATHDDAIVDALRKRVVELSDGRVVRDEEDGRYVVRGESLRSATREGDEPDQTEPNDDPAEDPAEPPQRLTKAGWAMDDDDWSADALRDQEEDF
ncbi:cell division ATP-binding protein FtsE [Kribbia dieselivorans]|uniref:cell division ATP-binding protein FtsE n=1 Tax=Kribbia dieselivorans TaxID=331526 RepID=UPI0009F8C934|nr:cell division ATP-binding protein FtsE [Kribbia dieselivorans]